MRRSSASRPPARSRPASGGAAPDPRIYGRHYRGPAPWLIGLCVAAVLCAGIYLAFAKSLPFTGSGFELHAKFANAVTVRPNTPVRIAGVNVGKVTAVEPDGEATDITFTVDDEGQPIHADATVEIRPRLFLEGSFFLDLSPGSPSAAALDTGATLPSSQTSVAVQIDEVLTALQKPDRKGLQKVLQGFGTALNHQPTRADDRRHDPDVHGETGAEALNQALRYGGTASRTTAIVNTAALGRGPHDLSRLVRAQQQLFAKLGGHEQELQDLISDFNVVAGTLADSSSDLSATIAELAPTLDQARPTLAHLSDALPPLRAFAREAAPSVGELAPTIDATRPWLRQAKSLAGASEVGGLAAMLERAAPSLAQATASSRTAFDETRLFGSCVSTRLIPTADIVVDDNGGAYPFGQGASGYPQGLTNYQEFLSSLVNSAGAVGGFDGNGSYGRVNGGGGSVLTSMSYPRGNYRNTTVFGNTQSAPLGTRPSFTSSKPSYRPDIRCGDTQLPDVNGLEGAGLPGDVGAPEPEAVP